MDESSSRKRDELIRSGRLEDRRDPEGPSDDLEAERMETSASE